MSSKALDEIIKFAFTRSTHYYRVEDLLIDNQNNIFARAFRILPPALASVENWQRDSLLQKLSETARLVISLACPTLFNFWITRPSRLKTTLWLKEIIKTRQWGSDTLQLHEDLQSLSHEVIERPFERSIKQNSERFWKYPQVCSGWLKNKFSVSFK